jgi:cephalosporin hydroxylase
MSDSITDDPQEIIRRANIVYFRSQVYETTNWMGVRTAKCPMDLWIYQEMMSQLKTDLLIETGTLLGGSALFFANMFDMMGRGKVISVDIEEHPQRPVHPRIEYLHGSSVSQPVLDQVSNAASSASSVLVVLDSDHKAEYKLRELNAYCSFVTPGSYIVAEDSGFDYYPTWPEFGPGPATAINQFLTVNESFEMIREWERHMITFSPGGYLRRKDDAVQD